MDITVLLADDHAPVRDSLRLLLEVQPDIAVVGEAADGQDALRQATQLCPDVVIMDISMPGLNGIETTQQVRTLCPTSQVIVLSMHSSAEYVLGALQAGALGYLLKESTGAEVVKAVKTIHAGRYYVSRKLSDRRVEEYVRQLAGPETKSRLAPAGLSRATAAA